MMLPSKRILSLDILQVGAEDDNLDRQGSQCPIWGRESCFLCRGKSLKDIELYFGKDINVATKIEGKWIK